MQHRAIIKHLETATQSEGLRKIINKSPFIPVIVINELKNAVPLAKALEKGGIQVIEVALRSPVALQAINQIKKECPNLTIGAATVMFTEQMDDAIEAGAEFCASPMFDEELLAHAKNKKFNYLPCVSDLTQITRAAKLGFRIQKLFPVESSEPDEKGEKFLRATKGMTSQLGVTFCTSCLETKRENMDQYLKSPEVSSVASGWSAPADLIATENWGEITRLARQDLDYANKLLAQKEVKNQVAVQTKPATTKKATPSFAKTAFIGTIAATALGIVAKIASVAAANQTSMKYSR